MSDGSPDAEAESAGSVEPAPPGPGVPRWNWPDVLVALGAGILASIAAFVAVSAVAGRDPSDAELFGIVFSAQSLGTLGALYLIVQRKGSGSLVADLGITFATRDAWGFAAGLGLQIVLALTLLPFLELLDVDEPPQEVVRLTQDAGGGLTVVAAFISVAVLAPLAEELLFRGMLLRSLRRRFRRWPAIAISAAGFAALHLLDPGALIVVPQLFAVGIVLGWMAERRGNLGLAITTHAGFNLTALVALLAAS